MRTKRNTIRIIRHYEPDLARQAQALLAVLRGREAQPPAHEGTAAAEGQSEAQKQQTPMVAP